ncbi:unnamed protein product [Closterium sp. NIES-65]|nr:unnamed protein product [Closterium sp. NIES-65]
MAEASRHFPSPPHYLAFKCALCPHVSKCALQGGAVVCKCPAPFKRLINNRCSSDDYPNSDYLDPHNAARAAVGAVPLEWDDAVASTSAPLLLFPTPTIRAWSHGGGRGAEPLTSLSPLLSPSPPSSLPSPPVAERAQAWADTLRDDYNCGLEHGGMGEMAERAQAWADTLRDDYNCGLEHGGMGEGEGQNLSGAGPAGWASNSDAVQWWVGEGKWYKRPPAVFPAGCIGGDWGRCGHYTQVIWNNSRQVGCGKASCGEDGDVWACNYYPAGNFVGEIPYVQDPCFRALCPSTSTCAAVNGKPVCLCPRGQVLVNGSKCQADPCKGAAPCPGDFVCDGTSGAAKCVCPKGTVQIAPNTCQAPSCKGVKCPASARCRADSNGIPFCACPASQSLVNGACTKAGPRTVTTSIVLFSRPSFAGTPIVLRGPTPDTDDATGCVNIPSPMAGTVGSLKILWDAPDGAKGTRVACGLMWFWSDADCYGDASGWDRPDNNVTIAKATDDGAAVVRAISCGTSLSDSDWLTNSSFSAKLLPAAEVARRAAVEAAARRAAEGRREWFDGDEGNEGSEGEGEEEEEGEEG